MTYYRYKATDDSFDVSLKVEGMNTEEEYFWKLCLQMAMLQWMKLFDRVPEVPMEFKDDD